MKYLITALLFWLLVSPTSARKRPFYDSKSNIVGCIGDYDKIQYGNKFYTFNIPLDRPVNMSPKELCEHWNKQNVGKIILDSLFCYDGASLSEDLLKELALKNVLKADEERAEIGVIDKDDILKEDFFPILNNQYIFVCQPSDSYRMSLISEKIIWSAYKINIDKEVLNQVYNSWNDMEKYNQIKVSISYVASGKGKTNIESKLKKKSIRKISRSVPAFAIRGQVISRYPFKINIGKNAWLKNRDKVVIYRSKEKKGELYSSKVCTTFACNVTDSTSNLYTFAGGQASYKKGDIAVYQPCKNSSWSITASYMDHSYNGNITYDHRTKLSKFGLSQYIMMMMGFGAYEKITKRLYATNTGATVHTPVIANFGLGYGLGYEFAHCIELQPYVLVQWEGIFFKAKDKAPLDGLGAEYAEGASRNTIRFPLGARLNINICYPVQLVVGAEYIFNVKVGTYIETDSEEKIKNDPEKFFFKPTGYKRDGVNVYAGFRFNF